MCTGGRTRAGSLLAVLIAGLVFATIGAVSASAAGSAGITGRVVNGTTGKPVAGLDVSLFDSQTSAKIGVAKTDTSGAFTFASVPDTQSTYIAVTNYKQGHYESQPIRPGAKPVTIKVYDVSTSLDKVKITGWVVWIDRAGGGIAVQQDVELDNTGKTAYVGSQQVSQGMAATLSLPLVPGAGNFQYLGQFNQCCSASNGTTFVHSAPVLPGKTTGTIYYTTKTPATQLDFPITIATQMFALQVPEGIAVSSDQLTPGQNMTDRGVTYQVMTATNLKKGDVIHVSLSGFAKTGGLSAASVLLAVGVVAALAAIGLLVLVLLQGKRRGLSRRGGSGGDTKKAAGRRPAAGTTATRKVGVKAGAASAGNGSAKVGRAEDEDASLIVDEIAALDLSFERGFMDEDTYSKLRAAAKARLVDLRNRSRAGEGAQVE